MERNTTVDLKIKKNGKTIIQINNRKAVLLSQCNPNGQVFGIHWQQRIPKHEDKLLKLK